jgi:hypothetical protein
MYKSQLIDRIADMLKGTLEAYEAADLCMEENDMGALYSIHDSLEIAIKYLRTARRAGRVLQEQYEENLDKKPEYIDLGDSIDEDDSDDGDDDDD